MKNGTKRIGTIAIFLALAAVLFSACSEKKAASAAKPKIFEITWGLSPATSAYYAIYSSVAVGIQKANPNLNITVMETGGNADSARKLRDGICNVSNGNMQSDMELYLGMGNFAGEARPDLRALWYSHVSVYQWVATKDSGIKSLKDFNGKYMNPGGIGTQQVQISQGIFKLFNITPRIFEGNQSVASDAFQNRQIVGIAKLGPIPDSFLQQLQATQELEFINITDEEYQQILTIYPFVTHLKVPAGAYEKTGEWNTIALWGGTNALSSLPQEVGYALIKGFAEDAMADFIAAYPEGKNLNLLKQTLDSKIPLHAGTVQYLEEKGYTVPPELIPSEYVRVKK